MLAAADTLKPEAATVVANLKRRGMEVVILTGDREETARAVASSLGIDGVTAGVLPDQKARHVKALQDEGRCVAMVGDGINDAPALAQADVSIAVGSGADAAMETSGVVLMGSGLGSLDGVFELSRRTLRVIRQNLFWAFFYNVALVPRRDGRAVSCVPADGRSAPGVGVLLRRDRTAQPGAGGPGDGLQFRQRGEQLLETEKDEVALI